MTKIIKTLLFCLIMMISLPSLAQKKVRSAFTPGSEIRFSIGSFPAAPSNLNFDYWERHQGENQAFTNENYYNALYNNGPTIITGAISVNYSYNILRWLSLGATFSYSGSFHETYSQVTREKVGDNNSQNFSLTPMLRFNYLNRPMVRLYSQIGVGLGFQYDNKFEDEINIQNEQFYASSHLTFFGVSVGRKLFGFAELGYGSQGTLAIGIGYNF